MTEPRPTILLVCCSVLTIVVCMGCIAGALGGLGPEIDSCSLLGIVFVLPFPSVLGIQQYRATFHSSPKAAKFTAIFFYCLAGFISFGFFTSLFEVVIERKEEVLSNGFSVILLLTLLAIALVSLFFGWQNSSWSEKLKLYYSSSGIEPPRLRFNLRELFLGVSVLAIMMGLSKTLLYNYRPPLATNVSSEESRLNLPAGASHVS